MEIIVPAAGLSTRFPNMAPKYTLLDSHGVTMLERSINPYVGKYSITVVLLAAHLEKYPVDHQFLYNKDIRLVILEAPTQGPAETVKKAIDYLSLDKLTSLFIKDCDSFFEHKFQFKNFVCYSSVTSHDVVRNLAAKSFVKTNEQNIITDIIEKQVVSDKFCVGGYGFESIELFCTAFNKLHTNLPEIFVSHVIQQCLDDKVFIAEKVSKYIDVGTIQEWKTYNGIEI